MSGSNKSDGNGGRAVVWMLLGLVLVFGGAYAAAYFTAGDKVPRGTTVQGVDIGARSEAAAAEAVRAEYQQRLGEPLTLVLDGGERDGQAGDRHEIVPRAWGIGVDPDATAAQAGAGQSLAPSRLWDYFTGSTDLEPVLTVNQKKFDKALTRLNNQVGSAPVEGTVGFEGSRIVSTTPEAGHGIDAEVAHRAITRAFLDGEQITLALKDVQPEIDAAAVQTAKDTFANPAVSGPVDITFGTASVRLQPSEFTPALSTVAADGVLVPTVDAKLLAQAVQGSSSYEGAPRDATVKIRKGVPTVVPARSGLTFDPAQLEAKFLPAVSSRTDRALTVDAVVADAAFTTEDAQKLGITEKVSSFTTQFPYAEYRNVNIGRAAEIINGTVLRPGEVYSMNDIVGERTRENGFTEGTMIADGVFRAELGGGVSQVATTTFNAMFFAGLEDVEHKPHSFYIDRYPVGREATVAWGSVDLRFRNDTDHGVLVEAHVKPSTPGSQGSITVSMWSTKVWDITTTTGPRYAFTSPATRHMSGPQCMPNSGYGGFQIDVKRMFHKPGRKKVERTENFHTTYTPSDKVICGPAEPNAKKKKKQ